MRTSLLRLLSRPLHRATRVTLVGAAALFGLLTAPAAWAQDPGNQPPTADPGRTLQQIRAGEVTNDTGYYIPGMPVPEVEGDAEGGDAEQKGKGGKISKVTKVERAGDSLRNQQAAIDRDQLQVGDIYTGIVPGVRDWHLLPRRARDAARTNPRKRNRLSWIGFQDNEAGSRIFVQTIREAAYQVGERVDKDGHTVVTVTLLGTRVPIYNNRRNLDTSFYPTAVIGADATPLGPNTVVSIRLHTKATYEVRQQGEFIFIQFADEGTSPFAETSNATDGEPASVAPAD